MAFYDLIVLQNKFNQEKSLFERIVYQNFLEEALSEGMIKTRHI